MEGSILKLYPQFTQLADRRQQSQTVNSERRSGEDRRYMQRVIDPKLNHDIAKIQDTFKAFIHNTDQYTITVKTLDNAALKNRETVKAVFSALSPIIPFRRISSIPDKIDDKDYVSAAGLLGVAGVLLPEDLRDMKDAGKQIFKGEFPKYNYKEFQTPFSFIRGSFLEPIVNKLGKWGYYLHEFDKPFLDTKFGEAIQKLLKVRRVGKVFTGREVPRILINEDGQYIAESVKVYAKKLEGSFVGKLICRALQRTTLYGAIILSAICIPSIVKAFNKPEVTQDKIVNASKQTLKSGITVTSVLSGIGIIGALMAPLGPAGSVIGMGIGSIMGASLSNKINKNIETA